VHILHLAIKKNDLFTCLQLEFVADVTAGFSPLTRVSW